MFDSIGGSTEKQLAQILAANAFYALSKPCRDYVALLNYIKLVCNAIRPDALSFHRDAGEAILDANPINPYLAYKQAPVEVWGSIDDAFELIRKKQLLRMAVSFDDAVMVEKIFSYKSADQGVNLSNELSRMVFDPLSAVRALQGAPDSLTYTELERRIKRQLKCIESPEEDRYWLSKTHPSASQASEFVPGLFSLGDLLINSLDHHLRHLPRYEVFSQAQPGAVGDCITTLIDQTIEKNPAKEKLLATLIKDLDRGLSSHDEIFFKYCLGMSMGQYLDLAHNSNTYGKMIDRILDVSDTNSCDLYLMRTAKLTLLSLVDPDLLCRHAKTDVQLRSAYLVTKDRSYLAKLSESGRDNQMGTDLGL
ncbi:hypothetical protein PLA107_033415 (plasmid) [Pseudomonas amygdali pv. lachrymans str. M301315]|uniref:Uncharacterized protein n=1 Tax=Pseudomonas amygdali pv. lachrymans str. M301315 TaxID=629260 RepID=A0AAD0VA28_PSEAV|nr:hypothetical protein PLA107_033415 [Pseudomonas amygdali pv. lachrymans str. M301315]